MPHPKLLNKSLHPLAKYFKIIVFRESSPEFC
jgi:hypothetical protein